MWYDKIIISFLRLLWWSARLQLAKIALLLWLLVTLVVLIHRSWTNTTDFVNAGILGLNADSQLHWCSGSCFSSAISGQTLLANASIHMHLGRCLFFKRIIAHLDHRLETRTTAISSTYGRLCSLCADLDLVFGYSRKRSSFSVHGRERGCYAVVWT